MWEYIAVLNYGYNQVSAEANTNYYIFQTKLSQVKGRGIFRADAMCETLNLPLICLLIDLFFFFFLFQIQPQGTIFKYLYHPLSHFIITFINSMAVIEYDLVNTNAVNSPMYGAEYRVALDKRLLQLRTTYNWKRMNT